MNSKQKYREHCQTGHQIPIFATDWWLDAVAGHDAWDVVVLEKDGGLYAALPYLIRYRFGQSVLAMPHHTPYLGVWCNPSMHLTSVDRLTFEMDAIAELVEALPPYARFRQFFRPGFEGGLALKWKGFNLSVQYTYILSDLGNLDAVFAGFRKKLRSDIRRASNKLRVKDGNVNDLCMIAERMYGAKGRPLPYTLDEFEPVYRSCVQRGQGKILVVCDEEDVPHAAAFIVWDADTAYYIKGASDPSGRASGAAALLIWEAIRYVAGVTRAFDFEGSMIPPIERFFRGFGARQTTYLVAERTPSSILRVMSFVQSALGRV